MADDSRPLPNLSDSRRTQFRDQPERFSLDVEQWQRLVVDSHQDVPAGLGDVGDPRRGAVASVPQQQITRSHRDSLEGLTPMNIGDFDEVALQILQIDAEVNPPVGAEAAGPADGRGIDGADATTVGQRPIGVNLRLGCRGRRIGILLEMNPNARVQEFDDWPLVCQLLPPGWQEQALVLGALRRARGFPDAAVLLRTLLVHLAGGCSLKETVTSAQQAGWCDVSAVALFQRLRAAEQWLRWMANELWQRHPARRCPTVVASAPSMPRPSAGPAASAPTGGFTSASIWRICSATSSKSPMFMGVRPSSESRWAAGDLLLGDRCYGTPPGIAHVAQAGGHVLVRVNHKSLPLFDIEGKPFRLVTELRSTRVGQVREWATVVRHGGCDYPGRLVAVKRDRWAACWERRALRKRASKKQKKLSRTALLLAGYFFVWTDVSTAMLDATAVLAWYRCRWQIERYFKRMKSILGLGICQKRGRIVAEPGCTGSCWWPCCWNACSTPSSIFPPGDTSWQPRRSRWREVQFLYRELVAAIVPPLGLAKVKQRWNDIAHHLADSPRKRTRQSLS